MLGDEVVADGVSALSLNTNVATLRLFGVTRVTETEVGSGADAVRTTVLAVGQTTVALLRVLRVSRLAGALVRC